MYADGSIFSYAVAVQDAWAFHWHNISGRLFVYLFCLRARRNLCRTDRGRPRRHRRLRISVFRRRRLLGLIATFAADRSKGRIIFGYACLSTACLCPLVFGFPTEMWMAHALFWPALAVCHYARGGIAGFAVVFAALLALVFTHEGALIFAVAILSTLLLRGVRDARVPARGRRLPRRPVDLGRREGGRSPPMTTSPVSSPAPRCTSSTSAILAGDLVLLLLGALAGYGIAFLVLRRLTPAKAHLYAAAIVAVALAVYWLWFDHALHTENRYFMRTALLIAHAGARRAGDGAMRCAPTVGSTSGAAAAAPAGGASRRRDGCARAIGAILLVMLVHAVETAKFVTAWTRLQGRGAALAMGTASDPSLGDPRFVSSARIGAGPEPAVLVFDDSSFCPCWWRRSSRPARLVVDPDANYFWLSCETATANEKAERVVPARAAASSACTPACIVSATRAALARSARTLQPKQPLRIAVGDALPIVFADRKLLRDARASAIDTIRVVDREHDALDPPLSAIRLCERPAGN